MQPVALVTKNLTMEIFEELTKIYACSVPSVPNQNQKGKGAHV